MLPWLWLMPALSWPRAMEKPKPSQASVATALASVRLVADISRHHCITIRGARAWPKSLVLPVMQLMLDPWSRSQYCDSHNYPSLFKFLPIHGYFLHTGILHSVNQFSNC